MAEIRIGNGNWAYSDDSLMGYSVNNNRYKAINFDSKRYCGKTAKNKDLELINLVNNVPIYPLSPVTKTFLII